MSNNFRDMDTVDLLKLLADVSEELYIRDSTANDKVSYFSKKRSDIEHEMETTSFDVFHGYYYAKDIQKYSMLRRIAKRDLDLFKLTTRTGGCSFERIYKYTQNIVKDYLLKDEVVQQGKEWSNYEKLGYITFGEMDDEYNKKFGTLEDQIKILNDSNE